MPEQQLRDRLGRLIGTIRTNPDGKMELRDKLGSFKGTYDPKNDETRDRLGRYVGKGNLLVTLLG